MTKSWSALALGAALMAGTALTRNGQAQLVRWPDPAGHDDSVTGLFSSLAGTGTSDGSVRGGTQQGRRHLCERVQQETPIKILFYDDQSVRGDRRKAVRENGDGRQRRPVPRPRTGRRTAVGLPGVEKHKIPRVMANIATPALYDRGFKYGWGTALGARTWSEHYFDMLSKVTRSRSRSSVVQDNPVMKAVDEKRNFCRRVGLKTVGTEAFAGTTKNFSGIILKIKAAAPDIIYISSFDAVSVPLLQQMRQLQVHAMDVHHIMANGLARPTGQPRRHHRRNLLARGHQRPVRDSPHRAARTPTSNLRLSLDHGPDGRLSRHGAGDRTGRRGRPRKGRGRVAQARRGQAPRRRLQVQPGRPVADRVLHHQMQKGEPVVVWPQDQATGKMIWPSPSWQ